VAKKKEKDGRGYNASLKYTLEKVKKNTTSRGEGG